MNHRFHWSGMLILALMLLTACFGRGSGNPVLGSDQTLSGQVNLVCSPVCSEQAQCGLVEQRETVLLSSTGPATRNHNLAVPAGSPALVILQQMEPAIQISDQTELRVPFYQVEVPNLGAVWVAGWCLAQ